MRTPPSFVEYVQTLGHLTAHVDPTAASPEAAEIKEAAESLSRLPEISAAALSSWARQNPGWAYALGLAVGLSREKLKNELKHHFDTSGWVTLARTRPDELITMLDGKFDLVRMLTVQRDREYDFGDILIARAGSRTTASRAGTTGRKVEDEIESIIRDLGLDYQPRTRFVGRGDR